jgi:hypothetical protein
MLKAGRSRVTFPMRSLDFSIGRTIALGLTERLTEMSTRNLHGGKGRSGRKAGNLIAICKPTV